MKFNIAHLSFQKDIGPHITVVETTLEDFVLQYVIGDNLFGFLNWVSRDWMYNVRWGPVDEDFGFAEKSLGAKMFAFAQYTGGGFGAWKRERKIDKFPVTREWVQEHIPDSATWPWMDDEEDTEKD